MFYKESYYKKMRTKFTTVASAAAFALLIGCGAMTGCTEKDVYDPNAGKPELKPEGDYFDFITSGDVDFDVNYGKLADGALLEIYTEDPMSYNDGTYSIDGEAIYKIFADKSGHFKGKIKLPAATNKVYIYSPSWGAPMYVEADVENGKVTVDETVADTRTTAKTRANANLTVWPVSGKSNLYSLEKWDNNKYGKITNNNGITSIGGINPEMIKQIQNSLWNGEDKKPDGLNNSNLITDTKHVNTVIARAYKNDKGETVNIKDAEIWLTFLSESAWHQNAIGYYYYPSDKTPTSANEVKRYILFPNTSITGNVPYIQKKAGSQGSYYDFGKNNAPLTINQKIQLLYVNEAGEVSTLFPAGYTIGYFIMPKEYQSTNNNDDDTYKLSNNYIYSNNTWNPNNKSNFISLSTKDGTVVYGVEDGGDSSYEDILFCIDADPNEAIQDPDRPVIDPEEPVITTTETTYRMYAYEDIWPDGGDYDLNDVIVEHERKVTITGDNYVTKVSETFTPMQEKDAATYNNAFAVQYDKNQQGAITLPDGAINEPETSSVILFTNVMAVHNQPFTVTRTFSENSLLKKDLITDLNPFIIVKYTAGDNSRTEVHLPKFQATSKANKEQIGAKDDAYYIDKSGKYPFAMELPLRVATETIKGFIPATEKKSIDNNYPDFTKWAESDGKTNTDWYLNYKPLK